MALKSCVEFVFGYGLIIVVNPTDGVISNEQEFYIHAWFYI